MVLRKFTISAFIVSCLGCASSTPAPDDSADFRQRFNALKGENHLVVQMAPGEDPGRRVAVNRFALKRTGKTKPAILSPHDILGVVNANMTDVRGCYKKQLDEDPEWADDLIMDLSVKKTGQLSELEISPGRVERDVIGQCLAGAIPDWQFPEFTGEMGDGMKQDVVSASLPLSFSTR